MSQGLIVVIGATGKQGGSVVNTFLQNTDFKIRGITRNTQSPNAQALAKRGVELAVADLDDLDSLVKAFTGATVIYAVTDFFEPFGKAGPEAALKIEKAQGINLAKAASLTPTLKHYIWSTLPNALQISNGAYHIPHFEGKNQIDDYIRSDAALLAKTTFFFITWFGSNNVFPPYKPTFHATSGKWLMFQPKGAGPETKILSIGDEARNVGPFVEAIVRKPKLTLPGKIVLAEAEAITSGVMLDIWGKVTGKETLFVEVDIETYDKLFPGWGTEMGTMMLFWNAFPERSWDGLGEEVVTRSELGVTGLASVEETMARLQLID